MERARIMTISTVSLLTALLYNVGILTPFFAVPMQYSASAGGRRSFLESSIAAVSAVLLFRMMLLGSMGARIFIILDVMILSAVFAGLYVCNFVLKDLSLPVRAAVVTAAAGLLTALLLPMADGLKEGLIGSMDSVLTAAGGSLPVSDAGLTGETLFLILADMAGKTALFWYFAFLVFSRTLGERLVGRIAGRKVDKEPWTLPELWVWFLFIPLTVYLLNGPLSVRGVVLLRGMSAYVVSNMILISSAAYAVRGIGIAGRFLSYRGIPFRTQRMILTACAFLVFMPGVNLALLILTAGIGVSELWVNYRFNDKE